MKAEMEKRKAKAKAKGGLFVCFGAPCRVDDRDGEDWRPRRVAAPSVVSRVSQEKVSQSSSRWPSLLAWSAGEEEGELREAAGSKRFPRRALAKVARSVVFVASLEKYRSEKAQQGQQSLPWEEKGTNLDAGFSSSSFSCSSSSDISSSAMAALSKEPMEPPKKQQPAGGNGAGWATEFCLLLLLILFIIIFWGRLPAIICASTCLCFARRGAEGPATGIRGVPTGSWTAESSRGASGIGQGDGRNGGPVASVG